MGGLSGFQLGSGFCRFIELPSNIVMKTNRTARNRYTVLAAGLLTIVGWFMLGCPYSLDEAIFLRKLSARISSGDVSISLPELMPGDWELVCESHGYDGPLYLKRYDKTFEPAAPMQDGVWGLIFIAKDGSYSSAVASRRSSSAYLRVDGCTERAQAILVRDDSQGKYPTFSVKYPVQPSTESVQNAIPSGELKR
jgi:hypothetical protein